MTHEVMDWVVAGRQSIHDRQLAVVGYELRFTTPDGVRPDSDSASEYEMTSEVVFGALNIGLDRLVGDKRIFCHADRALLVGSVPLTILPERTVIEVAASVGIDDAVIAGCRRLVAQGFTIAVDGFPWAEGSERMLEIASMVSIDVQAVRGPDLIDAAERARLFGVELLAEKVETAQELDQLREMGFDLFQGYALQQPTLESSRAVGAGVITRLRLAASLLSETLDFDEVEAVLRSEPGLSFQVIQLASLGRHGETRREIRSLREALVHAGAWRIQGWLALLLARPASGFADDEVTMAVTRARACELLAPRVDASPQIGFAAGMVSSFERLLQIPRDELSSSLPLSDELRQAAFGDQTPLGRVVCDVADHQSGRGYPRMLSGLTQADLDVALAAAFAWALEAGAALG
jgi:c-di-GMP phosphodiesterase